MADGLEVLRIQTAVADALTTALAPTQVMFGWTKPNTPPEEFVLVSEKGAGKAEGAMATAEGSALEEFEVDVNIGVSVQMTAKDFAPIVAELLVIGQDIRATLSALEFLDAQGLRAVTTVTTATSGGVVDDSKLWGLLELTVHFVG